MLFFKTIKKQPAVLEITCLRAEMKTSIGSMKKEVESTDFPSYLLLKLSVVMPACVKYNQTCSCQVLPDSGKALRAHTEHSLLLWAPWPPPKHVWIPEHVSDIWGNASCSLGPRNMESSSSNISPFLQASKNKKEKKKKIFLDPKLSSSSAQFLTPFPEIFQELSVVATAPPHLHPPVMLPSAHSRDSFSQGHQCLPCCHCSAFISLDSSGFSWLL